ncbi:hypothetical protein BS78_02G043500, partial [Paspalum vaginatum]
MAAYRQVLLLAVVVAAAWPASATQWMVGNGGGWGPFLNQSGWADGKTFRVGDSLGFRVQSGAHTVAQVGEEDFAACNLDGNLLGFWDSGSDVVQLDQPGKMWFICTKPGHCDYGVKLAVDVKDGALTPSPSPAP